jgi:hypothetical protein
MQHNIPEEQNPWLHCRENVKTHIFLSFTHLLLSSGDQEKNGVASVVIGVINYVDIGRCQAGFIEL